MTERYLADTSAWHRSGSSPGLLERWADQMGRDQIVICPLVTLELLYSARGRADYAALRSELDSLPKASLDEGAAFRSEVVQGLLAEKGQHRGPGPVDLLIAAIAELNGLTLVHYDRHFDVIARVTGQPSEWIAPRGTLD